MECLSEEHKTDQFGNITCPDGSIIYTSKSIVVGDTNNPFKEVVFNKEYFLMAMNDKNKKLELVMVGHKIVYVDSPEKALAMLKVYKAKLNGSTQPHLK